MSKRYIGDESTILTLSQIDERYTIELKREAQRLNEIMLSLKDLVKKIKDKRELLELESDYDFPRDDDAIRRLVKIREDMSKEWKALKVKYDEKVKKREDVRKQIKETAEKIKKETEERFIERKKEGILLRKDARTLQIAGGRRAVASRECR